MNDMDWYEAERFDRWVRDNARALRRRQFNLQSANPNTLKVKGIVLISEIYHRTNGVPVYEQTSLHMP